MTQRLDPWHRIVATAQQAIGPLPAEVGASWCAELDAVQDLVGAVERAVPDAGGVAPDGALALICLATARIGGTWLPAMLVEAAAALELADRAVRHHMGVTDRPYTARAANRGPILDGDLSITRAASLAAGISPAAYRALVRGYGCVQLAALAGPVEGGPAGPIAEHGSFGLPALEGQLGFRADASGLARAAVSMGLIVSANHDRTDVPSREIARVAGLVGWVTGFGGPKAAPVAVSGGVSAAP